MFMKKDFYILDQINEGPFWETFAVKTIGLYIKKQNIFFEARVMKKVKIIQLEEENNSVEEVLVRYDLRNIYLCNLIDRFQDYDSCFLISDLARGGYIYYYLRRDKVFTKKIAQIAISQIICVVQYLHKKGVLYRFLAPETIMITEKGNIKLRFDFLNKIGMTEKKYKENINYIPIEYIRKKNIHKGSDYWSIGVILYEFLYGVAPFQGKTYEETFYNIINKRLSFPKFLGDDVEDLLIRLLDKFDFRRLGSQKKDGQRIRRHPFFEGIDWDKIEAGAIRTGIFVGDIDFFNNKGIKMNEVYKSDLKKGQVDGYGYIFDHFGHQSKISSTQDY